MRWKVQRAAAPEKTTYTAHPGKFGCARGGRAESHGFGCRPVQSNKYQPKVPAFVEPEIPMSLIGPVHFSFKAGPYLDLGGQICLL